MGLGVSVKDWNRDFARKYGRPGRETDQPAAHVKKPALQRVFEQQIH